MAVTLGPRVELLATGALANDSASPAGTGDGVNDTKTVVRCPLAREQQLLDSKYIADMVDVIIGAMNGTIVGEPFLSNYRVGTVPGNAQRNYAGVATNQWLTRATDPATHATCGRGQ